MGNEQEVADTWTWFKESGSQEARNWLIVNYSSLIRPIASRVCAKLAGHVDQDDLSQYGLFGLVDAIEKFDPERGARFDGYAKARIQGQMYDEVRKLSWVPRNVLAKGRDLEKAREELEVVLGRPAEHAELAEYLGMDLLDYWRTNDMNQITIVPLVSDVTTAEFDSFESTYNTAEIDHASNPEDAYQVTHVAMLVGKAVSGMDERLRMIFVLHYIQDMTLVEIGEILGITGGRVSQLISRALIEIRDDLGTMAA